MAHSGVQVLGNPLNFSCSPNSSQFPWSTSCSLDKEICILSDPWRYLSWVRRLSGQQPLCRIMWNVQCRSKNKEKQKEDKRERFMVMQSWRSINHKRKVYKPALNMMVSVLVPQSCPTFCNAMDCSLSSSSVHKRIVIMRIAITVNSGNVRKLIKILIISGILTPFSV